MLTGDTSMSAGNAFLNSYRWVWQLSNFAHAHGYRCPWEPAIYYHEICVRRFLIKLEFGIGGFRLPSSCTRSSQAVSVNAFRWRIEAERPRLARTTWPETHRPRAIMIPRDYTRFLRSGETETPCEPPLPNPWANRAKERTSNKLNPNMVRPMGLKPRRHWWKEPSLVP